METGAHQALKALGTRLLLEAGCLALATEVACPISRYRADVAGYLDPLPARARGRARAGPATGPRPDAGLTRGPSAKTVLIECKQSRADFLRDRQDLARLLEERRALEARAAELEARQLREAEPALRFSESLLFAELEGWDYAASASPTYRRLLRALRRLDAQIHGQTKFWAIGRYRLADLLYVAAPRGVVRPREVPAGWGLLECRPRALRDPGGASAQDALLVTVPAPERQARPERRQRLLRNIAVAATRAALARSKPTALGAAAPSTTPGTQAIPRLRPVREFPGPRSAREPLLLFS
ncbi:MAG TPA: hypothetical protein VD963_08750 [Phycisphaerales bacterium]|nr:hypothetical protein [Phycisphaerales bacterium]